MIVDPHTHTTVSSPCSLMDPDELIGRALTLGLGAIAVTEHGHIAGAKLTRDLAGRRGLLCFRGVEVYTPEGDMLVYGVCEDIAPRESALELIQWVHERDGVVVAAHPFRGRFGLQGRIEGLTPDAVLAACDGIETHNGADPPEAREAAAEAAGRLGLPGMGGSDSHRVDDVGRCVTILTSPVSSEEQFIAQIKAGRCKGATFDEALGEALRW